MFQPSDGSDDDQWPPYTRPVAGIRFGWLHKDSSAHQQNRQTALVNGSRLDHIDQPSLHTRVHNNTYYYFQFEFLTNKKNY